MPGDVHSWGLAGGWGACLADSSLIRLAMRVSEFYIFPADLASCMPFLVCGLLGTHRWRARARNYLVGPSKSPWLVRVLGLEGISFFLHLHPPPYCSILLSPFILLASDEAIWRLRLYFAFRGRVCHGRGPRGGVSEVAGARRFPWNFAVCSSHLASTSRFQDWKWAPCTVPPQAIPDGTCRRLALFVPRRRRC